VPQDFYDAHRFTHIADLTHEVLSSEVLSLGVHLNRYLRHHGPIRTPAEWQAFYDKTVVRTDRGVAAFWIALSFWLQYQFDLTETIQSWVYRQYSTRISDLQVQRTILDIAALSTERLPMPDAMLPATKDWPISQKIEDLRRDVPGLSLTRLSRDGERYWALVHDVIGRFLITALYYDYPSRERLGYADAQNPEHLRFLLLRDLSSQPALGYSRNRTLGEEYAMSIFKIDPDHGHATFSLFWREVLDALDSMPRNLRTTSRAFLHHTAISRRRISKQKDLFPLEASERVTLLRRAISDIRYALDNIPAEAGGEADLNLYNSLAHAYQDLADEQELLGEASSEVSQLRLLARDAAQQAYRSDPDNSFVVETYARNLLSQARSDLGSAAAKCIEVLNIVYAAMERDTSGQRRFALGKLADSALGMLLDVGGTERGVVGDNEISLLTSAIRVLASGVSRREGMELSDFPAENRERASAILASPPLLGNPQAVRLRYSLLTIDEPYNFREQLELLQSLQDGSVAFTPQMRLELALLLQQCDRHVESQRLFRELRRLWKETDYIVHVPDRLRWLRGSGGGTERQVTARVVGDSDYRRMAKVRELQETEVLFRPEEFGQQTLRPGTQIKGLISFGHNGPFLRPTTALAASQARP